MEASFVAGVKDVTVRLETAPRVGGRWWCHSLSSTGFQSCRRLSDVVDMWLQNNGRQSSLQHRPERDPAGDRGPVLVRNDVKWISVVGFCGSGETQSELLSCWPQVQGLTGQHCGSSTRWDGPGAGPALQSIRGPEDRVGGPAGTWRPGPLHGHTDHDQVVGYSRYTDNPTVVRLRSDPLKCVEEDFPNIKLC